MPLEEMEPVQQSPGRVNLSAGKDTSRLPGFAYATKAPSNAGQEGIRGNLEATPLNQAYFSAANFQICQNGIRAKVYEKSGEIIDPVGSDDLFMVMRAIYLWYGKNLPTSIPEQITNLNERVISWCVPKILAEVSMYKTYTHDISTLPVPLSHPVSLSSAGTRSLPFKPFF
jgi:hypothetical protein